MWNCSAKVYSIQFALCRSLFHKENNQQQKWSAIVINNNKSTTTKMVCVKTHLASKGESSDRISCLNVFLISPQIPFSLKWSYCHYISLYPAASLAVALGCFCFITGSEKINWLQCFRKEVLQTNATFVKSKAYEADGDIKDRRNIP